MSFAAVTFLEIPDPRSLTAWLDMLDRNEFSESFLKQHPYLPPEAVDGGGSDGGGAEVPTGASMGVSLVPCRTSSVVQRETVSAWVLPS